MKLEPLSEAERAFLLGGEAADFAETLGRHLHVRLRRGVSCAALLRVTWQGGAAAAAAQGGWLEPDEALLAAWGAVRWGMSALPRGGGFAARVEGDLRRRLARAFAQAWLDGGGVMESLRYQVQLQGRTGACNFYPAVLGDGAALARWAQAYLEQRP